MFIVCHGMAYYKICQKRTKKENVIKEALAALAVILTAWEVTHATITQSM
jgi:hypothetical protein